MDCLHNDVNTILGHGLDAYTKESYLDNGKLAWRNSPEQSLDDEVLTSTSKAFSATGGLKVLKGNMGVSVIKNICCKSRTLVCRSSCPSV